MESSSEIRSFIAIELSAEAREQLRVLEDSLRAKLNMPASWVKPDNCHLTLKFLGNVTQQKLAQVAAALNAVAQETSPFYLELDGLGVFPNIRHPRILWVGLAGDISQLLILHKNIDHALSRLGFSSENRPFSPHLTLCRIREDLPTAVCAAISNSLSTIRAEDKARFQVVELTLFKSELTPGGPIYTRLIIAACGKEQ